MVAKSAAAGRQLMQDLFPVDKDGVNRFAATIDAAIGYTTASRGDVILVAPGHTETITGAAGIALDVAGVSVIGLGTGSDRPVITISSTDNSGTITQSGNNTRLENIVVVTNDDGLTNAVVVTGNNCYTDIEHQDTSAAVEAATVLRGDTADNWTFRLKHIGFSSGNAGVSTVRLDACSGVRGYVDFNGQVSTAVVEMVDSASSNVFIEGLFEVSGTTNLSKNVVDTVTGSGWAVRGYDISAGAAFDGGSGNAVATFVPGLGYPVTKTEDVNVATGDDLFIVTGKVLITCMTGEVTNAIGAAVVDYKLRIKTDNIDLCAAGDISADAIGTMYSLTGDASDSLVTAAEGIKAVDHSDSGMANRIVGLAGGSCTIESNRTAGDAGDAISWTLFYLPLETGASVAASA